MKNKKIYSIIIISLMSGMICLSTLIQINFVIPFTLQIFGISITLLLIGGKRGTISILIYLILGLIGLPIFAGFKNGIEAFMGPTGGFLIGFLLMGIIYLLFELIIKKDKIIYKLFYLLIGLIICYLIGIIWFKFVYHSELNIFNIFKTIILPFIIPDLLKIIFAFIIYWRLKKHHLIRN